MCSAYRTVSTDAALVIARLTPIYLLVEERIEVNRQVGADR